MSAKKTLETLLRQRQENDFVQYSLTDLHAPMVMIALYRLGSGENRIKQYYDNLSMNTPDSTAPQQQITASEWTKHLRDLSACSAYCRFFLSEIERVGTQAVLRSYVSKLMAGVAGHAFHPLLRLGYAIDFKDDREIALGLGYLAATYLPAPEMPTNKESIGAAKLLDIMANTASLRKIEPDSDSDIEMRIEKIYSHQDFQALLRPIRFDSQSPLNEISAVVADAFVSNHHFTLLHGVTGCHAFRKVLPYCENLQKQISEYWYSVCAAYLSVINLEADMKRDLPNDNVDWQQIKQQTINSDVEHTIKLAYTCFDEYQEYRRDIYKHIALRDIAAPAPFF